MTTAPTVLDRTRGCLLGGAAGDALGAAVEFMSLAEIRAQFGPAGIQDYAPAYGRRGAITDDTQMTLFTAEGVMRGWGQWHERGICDANGVMQHAYLRWLLTQRERLRHKADVGRDGWLFGVKALHSRRAPGRTCVSALRATTAVGLPGRAENDSKGCGGVMRVAPVGLFAPAIGDDSAVFTLAADAAHITHGHPSGYLSAGYLAVVVASLLRESDLPTALDMAAAQLERHEHHEETDQAVAAASALAACALAARRRPTPEQIETLGGGWVGEEALAIAVCCALVADDFADGIRLAVNHSGDSDSTGAIAGNILGALWGERAIPAAWLAELELRDEIGRVADDLHAIAAGQLSLDDARDRYPGW